MIIMAESVLLLGSFLLFMLFFAGVGLASMRVKEDTTDDYLVAGRGMHPALAALSAVSTWNSGYMFIGFIGFIFLNGYSAVWIAVVSTIGQLVAWIWLYKYIQKEGETRGIRSLSSLVSNTTGSPEAKGSGCSFRNFPLHLCSSTTDCWRYCPRNDAQMVSNHRYSHRFRLSCRLLLRWRNSCFDLDRCCSIVCDDCRFNHLVCCRNQRKWWLFRLTCPVVHHRACHGQFIPLWVEVRRHLVDCCILPRWPRRCWPTTGCLTCNDAQGRQRSKASNGLVLRLANSFHHSDVPHRTCMPRLITGTWRLMVLKLACQNWLWSN